MVYYAMQEYKMHNTDILFKDDATVDDLIDVIEGNRRYVKCLYVYNKIDVCSIEEVDEIARQPNSIPASAGLDLNMDGLLAAIWEKMALVRVYTKKVTMMSPRLAADQDSSIHYSSCVMCRWEASQISQNRLCCQQTEEERQ